MDQQQPYDTPNGEEAIDYGYETTSMRGGVSSEDEPERTQPQHRSFRGESFDDEDNEIVFTDGDDTTDDVDTWRDDSQGELPKENAVTEVERLAKPSLAINVGRGCVLFLLLALGGAASLGTYFYLEKGEEDDYSSGFSLVASTIEDSARHQLSRLTGALQGLSAETTAFAVKSNSFFPQVTMPFFEVNAHQSRLQADFELVALVPFVRSQERGAWQNYSVQHQDWVKESQTVSQQRKNPTTHSTSDESSFEPISSNIFELYDDLEGGQTRIPAPERDSYAPVWMSSPPNSSLVNLNVLTDDYFAADVIALVTAREIIISRAFENETALTTFLPATAGNKERRPFAAAVAPIFSSLDHHSSEIAGFYVGWFDFQVYLSGLVPDLVRGIHAVLSNSCGQSYTYCLEGKEARFCGEGDNHDTRYNDKHRAIPFQATTTHQSPFSPDTTTPDAHESTCKYTVDIYASAEFEESYASSIPFVAASMVAVVFVGLGLAFFVYDFIVQKRNDKVVGAAARSTAIVSSLFPANVRDRLFASKSDEEEERKPLRQGAQSRLRRFLNDEDEDEDEDVPEEGGENGINMRSKPIADLFPECTIMFGDIVGFTAWSSVREPAQVFTLLETVFSEFDEIAKRRRVFKVETVGDCYVAVVGLPDPRKDHAVIMARFARDCMASMQLLTKSMEVELGPDTGDLCMRVGLHSGPVTAGVLRGERSRFQLFGDTVNTAARMESTGTPRRIQMSRETADLLCAAGKEDWIKQRENVVVAKGKGSMTTFWLTLSPHGRRDTASSSGSLPLRRPSMVQSFIIADMDGSRLSEKTARLIEWNVEVLLRLLKQCIAHRNAAKKVVPQRQNSLSLLSRVSADEIASVAAASVNDSSSSKAYSTVSPSVSDRLKTPLEEVVEVVRLPDYDANVNAEASPDSIELSVEVVQQLSDLVSRVAGMYHKNPFHNFEHASHVTMSVVKLLSRIVAPELDVNDMHDLHDHTYGITSDPLTQFACVLSALIHDIDHPGVPNTQLVKEGDALSDLYKGKSVAEQNSVTLAWKLFSEEKYNDLRKSLCPSERELRRLRQLVVNSVMATDIMDKDLKQLRNERWEKAFSQEETSVENRNRKATIVIEHLIQASDVAHTMQHWHIYRKWNERLFAELCKAYDDGRAAKHPAEFWYEGELGFFDGYIIPLAKKLKDCGVFGVSSDEYLNYALKNRQEWESRGNEVVSEMVEKLATYHAATTRKKERPLAETRRSLNTSLGFLNRSRNDETEKSLANQDLPESAPPKQAGRRFSGGSRAQRRLSNGSKDSTGSGFFGGRMPRRQSNGSQYSKESSDSRFGMLFGRRFSGSTTTTSASLPIRNSSHGGARHQRRNSGHGGSGYMSGSSGDGGPRRRNSTGGREILSADAIPHPRRFSSGFYDGWGERRFSGEHLRRFSGEHPRRFSGGLLDQGPELDAAASKPQRTRSGELLAGPMGSDAAVKTPKRHSGDGPSYLPGPLAHALPGSQRKISDVDVMKGSETRSPSLSPLTLSDQSSILGDQLLGPPKTSALGKEALEFGMADENNQLLAPSPVTVPNNLPPRQAQQIEPERKQILPFSAPPRSTANAPLEAQSLRANDSQRNELPQTSRIATVSTKSMASNRVASNSVQSPLRDHQPPSSTQSVKQASMNPRFPQTATAENQVATKPAPFVQPRRQMQPPLRNDKGPTTAATPKARVARIPSENDIVPFSAPPRSTAHTPARNQTAKTPSPRRNDPRHPTPTAQRVASHVRSPLRTDRPQTAPTANAANTHARATHFPRSSPSPSPARNRVNVVQTPSPFRGGQARPTAVPHPQGRASTAPRDRSYIASPQRAFTPSKRAGSTPKQIPARNHLVAADGERKIRMRAMHDNGSQNYNYPNQTQTQMPSNSNRDRSVTRNRNASPYQRGTKDTGLGSYLNKDMPNGGESIHDPVQKMLDTLVVGDDESTLVSI